MVHQNFHGQAQCSHGTPPCPRRWFHAQGLFPEKEVRLKPVHKTPSMPSIARAELDLTLAEKREKEADDMRRRTEVGSRLIALAVLAHLCPPIVFPLPCITLRVVGIWRWRLFVY